MKYFRLHYSRNNADIPQLRNTHILEDFLRKKSVLFFNTYMYLLVITNMFIL